MIKIKTHRFAGFKKVPVTIEVERRPRCHGCGKNLAVRSVDAAGSIFWRAYPGAYDPLFCTLRCAADFAARCVHKGVTP